MDPRLYGGRGNHWANAIGRMKPRVSAKAALADLKIIAARLEKQYPGSNGKVGAAATRCAKKRPAIPAARCS